jgi:hypothetical protein
MADPRPRARRGLRALFVTAVAAASLGVVPLARSGAAPETVLRAVPVDARGLLPRAAGPAVALSRDGRLIASTAARTARIPICAPIWFNGVAVTWNQEGGGAPTTLLATSADGTTYGRSTPVEEDGGPDPGTTEYRAVARGTSYVWTGGSRCVRMSMDLPKGVLVSDVRVLFINSSGTATGAATGAPDVGPVAVGGPGGLFAPTAASALTQQPRMITREQWGADPRLMNCTPLVADFLRVGFVHHTAGTNSYTRSQADDIVRGIYAYDTNGHGWCDIGYNFLVDRFGDVFEGRSGGITNDVVGAAQMGFNTGAFSLAMMGTFDHVAPPSAAMRALKRLLAWRLDVAHLNPKARAYMTSAGGYTDRYPRGTSVLLHTISGHRDTGITDCPGTILYGLLPKIRSAVAGIGLPKIYAPRLSITSYITGQPVNIHVRARGSTTMTWSVSVLDPTGAAIATFPDQAGDRLDVLWSASGPPQQPAAPGTYFVVIQATTREGARARPAVVTLTVEPVPSPSPPPSPTVSPSPTPSPTASQTP